MDSKSPPKFPPVLGIGCKDSICSVELHDTVSLPQTNIDGSHTEMRVRRKLDFYLMPILVLGFLALQLDRSNLANALTNTLRQDLDLSLAQINTGAQLLQAGIIIAEIPANIILQRLGPRVWLTFLLATWGTVTLTQAFMTNVHSFYATRFLLGVFEGGYIPGSQYVMALFYKSDELALRTAIFYIGNYAATGTGSLIAAGILEMHGIVNLSGWRWLFILEGAFTIVVSFVFLLLMPESPSRTKPLHGQFDVFTKEERDVLQARISHADASKWEAKAKITWATLRDAVWNIRPLLHMLLNAVAQTPKGALQLYSPSIIRSLGFNQLHSNLLNSVSSYGVVVLSLIISIASDKFRQRGLFCIVAFVWSIAFCGALVAVRTSHNKWLRYAMLTLLGSGNALAQALNDVWLSINSRSAHGRSIGLAMAVMGSNVGGLTGPQLFQPDDAPLYTHGFIAILCLYAASIIIALVIMWVYMRDNKKLERQQEGGDVANTPYEI